MVDFGPYFHWLSIPPEEQDDIEFNLGLKLNT